MQKSRSCGRTRGAALVEYGVLVGLIAVVAIGAVSRLGEEVSSTFEDVATAIDLSGPAEEEEPAGPTITFDFDGDTDDLPPYVTVSGNYFIIDIEAIMPDRSLLMNPPRFSAWISNTGTFQKRWPDRSDSTSSLSVHAFAEWIREGKNNHPLVAASDMKTPSGTVTAYNSVSNYYIPDPDLITGIELEPRFHCNLGSICEKGAFQFNIEFH